MQLLAEKKIDALIGFPPVPQELREKKIGHVIVNSGLDRPWSQYFCCIPAAHREFVRKHPMATKRALRAIVKATNFCAAEPERARVGEDLFVDAAQPGDLLRRRDRVEGEEAALSERGELRGAELRRDVRHRGAQNTRAGLPTSSLRRAAMTLGV
jgi:ABC-type nitrate/sulfonate/bicarbonate transport system substrate-binding protein